MHNFGLDDKQEGLVIGKMFGVLVVQNKEGELGYLAAFSGKLAESNHWEKFVPPVFDMLQKESYFKQEEQILNGINREIEILEKNEEWAMLRQKHEQDIAEGQRQISECKLKIKKEKKIRKQKRETAQHDLAPDELEILLEQLRKESIKQQYYLKDLNHYWKERKTGNEKKLAFWEQKITALKQARKKKSAALQSYLFEQYQFLNLAGKTKNLLDIFSQTVFKTPPAGAGECAAPKLLQYAFSHDLKPICMAEFWWGASPKSEIRKHQNFYAACKGKCEPILGHMLEGIETDPNPLLINYAEGREVPIIYEDDVMLVVNKPHEFLTVPGKHINDSVYWRMKQKYPEATGPLVVHRLDMSTSGIVLIAKDKESHKILQRQFIKRTIQKRYVALLDGVLQEDEGIIDLPLRGDINDRPRQLVCFEHGKSARTKWKVVAREGNKTRIHFFPITGRTHQLRVHAAHLQGLNTPILGDDLYGKVGERLCLHAEWIEFQHPIRKKTIQIKVESDF